MLFELGNRLQGDPGKTVMDSKLPLPPGLEIKAPLLPEYSRVLEPEALAFVAKLCRRFESRRPHQAVFRT